MRPVQVTRLLPECCLTWRAPQTGAGLPLAPARGVWLLAVQRNAEEGFGQKARCDRLSIVGWDGLMIHCASGPSIPITTNGAQ